MTTRSLRKPVLTYSWVFPELLIVAGFALFLLDWALR